MRVARTPKDVLNKLSDDVEAHLEIFEQMAHRVKWPVAEWAGILAPFLSGEAQQAYRHLSSEDQTSYASLSLT